MKHQVKDRIKDRITSVSYTHLDVYKRQPFVCGAKDLGEALRRINEGASMIRTKGEPGTGDVVQAVRHMRMMNREIARITSMRQDELFEVAKELRVPYELVLKVHDTGRLPVVNFAAGGVATPADAALMMQLGACLLYTSSGSSTGNPFRCYPCNRTNRRRNSCIDLHRRKRSENRCV